ncbi:MAG: NADH-quinone oxidoreductase subunit C [Deltaproteobacteria bacterium]|jgi:Ni,Fe-hydrogenase III component G
MFNKDNVATALTGIFPALDGKIKVPRDRRVFLEADETLFPAVFDFIVKQLFFGNLCTITGLDDGENLSFIYHLAHRDGTVINLKRSVPKTDPLIKTVTGYFPGAANYERELVDLLGAKVDGLPPGNRYPLPDDFPTDQFPLRKEWKSPASLQGAPLKDDSQE